MRKLLFSLFVAPVLALAALTLAILIQPARAALPAPAFAGYQWFAQWTGADQTAALNAALNALSLAGGGTLILPTGTIGGTTATISVPAHVTLECPGASAAMLKPLSSNPGFSVVTITGDGGALVNCAVNGNASAANNADNGVQINPGVTGAKVLNNNIFGSGANGIIDFGISSEIANNNIHDDYENCIYVKGLNNTTYAEYGDIHSNTVGPNCSNGQSNPSWDAIDLDPDHSYYKVHDNWIFNDDITDFASEATSDYNYGDEIYNNHIMYSYSSGVQVVGNVSTVDVHDNIIVSPTKQSGNVDSGFCVIFDIVSNVSGSNAQNRNRARNNICISPATDGFYAGDTNGANRATGIDISGNHIESVSATYAGIRITSAAYNWTINANTSLPGSGAYAIDTSAAGAGSLTDNTVTAGATGTINYALNAAQFAHGNSGFNYAGNLSGAPSLPSTGTAQTNGYPFPVSICVSGGTVSAIAVAGVATGLTSGCVTVGPNQQWTPTYSAAPTVKWFGL